MRTFALFALFASACDGPPVTGPMDSSMDGSTRADVSPRSDARRADATREDASAPIPIEPGQIAGFGLNGQPRNWGTDGRAVRPALELLVNDLGANLFRVEIAAGQCSWEEENDDGDPMHFEWSAFDPVFESKAFTDLFDYIRVLNELGVEEIYLAVHGLLPDWMGRESVADGMEDELVETLLAVLLYARTRAPEPRPRFTMFGPWNETDLGPPEGIRLGPGDGVPLLRRLIARMDELAELDGIGIVAPDASSEGVANEWRDAMLADDTITARLSAVAFHRYGGYGGTSDRHRADPPQWLTEFNDWGGYCYIANWGHAMRLAGNLIGALESGVTAGLVWTDYDAPHSHDADQWETFGLLAAFFEGSDDLCARFRSPPDDAELDSIDYRPKPTYHAARHIYRYIARGAELLEIDADVVAVAFENTDGTIAVAGINEGGARTASITFADRSPGELTPHVSVDGDYHRAGAPIPVSSGAIELELPADSVFTLVGR
jgi:hypothetical protein